MEATDLLLVALYLLCGLFFFLLFLPSRNSKIVPWTNAGFIVGTTFVYIYFIHPSLAILLDSYYFGDSYSYESLLMGLGTFILFGGFFVTSYKLSRRSLKKTGIGKIDFNNMANSPVHILFLSILLLGIPGVFSLLWLLSLINSVGFDGYMANRIVLTSGAGYYFAPIIWLPSLSYLLAIEGSLDLNRSSKKVAIKYIGAILALAASVFSGLMAGSRTKALLPVVIITYLIFIVIGKGRFTRKSIVIFCFVVLLLLVTAVGLGDIRHQIQGGSSIYNSRISDVNIYKSLSANLGVSEHTFWWFDNPMKTDFLYGKSILAAFVGWIPRSIWIDKPVGGGPEFINMKILNAYDLKSGTGLSSVTTGIVLEGLINFGIMGVAIMGSLFGIVVCQLDRLSMRVNDSLQFLLWILVLYNIATYLFEEFFGATAEMVVTVTPILFLVCVSLLHSRSKKRGNQLA